MSAKKCYSYNETVACVEMCALHGEMLSIFLCITSQEKLISDSIKSLIKESDARLYDKIIKSSNPRDLFDTIRQSDRISWLRIARLLSDEEVAGLKDVHETRRQYYHHWSKALDEIDNDALRCLESMSNIASNHLELFFNQDNINKIKAYHQNSVKEIRPD